MDRLNVWAVQKGEGVGGLAHLGVGVTWVKGNLTQIISGIFKSLLECCFSGENLPAMAFWVIFYGNLQFVRAVPMVLNEFA